MFVLEHVIICGIAGIYEGRLKSSEPDQEAGATEPWNLVCIKSKHYRMIRFLYIQIYLHKPWNSGLGKVVPVFFVKMDKIWHRGVIKYLHKKGLAPKDIHADMVAT